MEPEPFQRPLTAEEERKARIEVVKILEEMKKRKKRRHIYDFYPDTGPLSRSHYKPQMDFFKAGGMGARERCLIGGNGVGKTEGVGGYEVSLHLTGLYPDWWEGRRFNNGVRCWVAGDTGQTVKEVTQAKLIGHPGEEGTGLIPGDLIVDMKKKAGNVADAIESVVIKHLSGENSHVTFKSFDQKRRAFQGTEREVIWLDEECPPEVYDECLMRTRKVNGMVMLTFTPLMGLTPVVLSFMPNGEMPKDGWVSKSKYSVNATWDDAPHLTDEEKEQILSGTMPHLRDARAKGIPTMGMGAIYPILPDDIIVDPFEIPPWFRRVYALDVGWNCTAATWGAWDTDNDIVYLTSCHKQGRVEPATHIHAINARGEWIPGVIDPAASGSSQLDGKRLIDEYAALGLNLSYANNAVEAGIFAVWERLVSGRLKVFSSLTPWLNEFKIYRRDDNGNVMRAQDDHLMDTTRYLILSGLNIASLPPYDEEEDFFHAHNGLSSKRKVNIYGLH